MKKIFLSFFILATYYLLHTTYAAADGNCQPIYGGGQYGAGCPTGAVISIKKTVQNPNTGVFVENLGIKDIHFSPNQLVSFQITVMNTGKTSISKITVRDTFPQFINFLQGNGNFDQNTKTFTFDVTNIAPNESRMFNVLGQIADVPFLPKDKTTTCVVNQASALLPDTAAMTQSSSQFCIERTLPPATTKGGLPIFPAPQLQTTPATGPEALPFLLLIPTGVIGFLIRKRSNLI